MASPVSDQGPQTTTLIIGGGIIGLSTAYYLSLSSPDHKVIIIDSASSLLLSSSGYAGGFLARDWFSASSAELGELSFDLHRRLAKEHDGSKKWGYARSTAYSLSVSRKGVSTRGKNSSNKKAGRSGGGKGGTEEGWLREGESRAAVATGEVEMLNADGTPAWITQQPGGSLETISGPGSCAQVEPRQLCTWMIEQCKDRGVEIRTSCRVKELAKDQHGKNIGVSVQDGNSGESKTTTMIPCTNILIAAGAWSGKVFRTLFPDSRVSVPISGLAGYSIVVRSPRYTKIIVDPDEHDDLKRDSNGMCHSVFCGPGRDWKFAPEAISRVRDGRPEIYVAGLNAPSLEVGETADDTNGLKNKKMQEELKRATVTLTGLSQEGGEVSVDDLDVVREGLCFRPISDSGKPILSRINEKLLGKAGKMADGGAVFLASGHGPWGISLGPGTGRVMADLILGKTPTVDVSGLGL